MHLLPVPGSSRDKLKRHPGSSYSDERQYNNVINATGQPS
jgi:hypothetical protein